MDGVEQKFVRENVLKALYILYLHVLSFRKKEK